MENEPLIDEPLKHELSALYRAGGRHYHGIAHVETLLALAAEYRAILSDPHAIEAAIWFHDAVYDSRARDNESRSAALAEEMLGGHADKQRLARIMAMIEATATHELSQFAHADAARDAALFLDMDLSTLGASPDAFNVYERAVRLEYGWVDESSWRIGRAGVLKIFLARPHIFHTPEFRARFEEQARENLTRSLKSLEA